MGLEWVRLDTNIGTNDKVVDLLAQPNGAKAFALYICALGWCGGQTTDGLVKRNMLPLLHGSEKLADLLVDVGLWVHDEAGAYKFPTWERRQEPAIAREVKRTMQQQSAKRTNCLRWHGKECGCWQRDEGDGPSPLRAAR